MMNLQRGGVASCSPGCQTTKAPNRSAFRHTAVLQPVSHRQRASSRTPTTAAIVTSVLADVDVATASAAAASAAGPASSDAAGCSGLGCAQEFLDNFGRPFASIADLIPASSVLPGLAVVLSLTGLAIWRVAVYGQREYIIAAMIRKYVPKSGARVLQVGGTTRDAFYYPDDTVSVKVVGEDIRPGLMEQAGAQAGVPVEARKGSPTDLSFQGTGSLDAVVAFNALAAVGEQGAEKYLEEVGRVLKPGAPFIFIDRVKGEGLAAVAQPLVGNAFLRIDEAALQLLRRAESLVDVTGEIALKGQDPHAVGVAFRAGGAGTVGAAAGSRKRDSDAPRRKARGSSRDKAKGFAGGKR